MAEPLGEAQYLLEHKLLNEIFDKLEHDATERAIHARASDDETRRTSLEEVRAIRHVRAELKTLAEGSTNRKARGSVA